MESNKKIKRKVALICVGSELLRGKINTHCSTLARRLASIGLELAEERTVGDEFPLLVGTLKQTVEKNEVIIITGGLGPTFDDVTREACAEALGLRLELSSKLAREIRFKFRRAQLKSMPPANERQAYLLKGATSIPNSVGTAPGQWLRLGGKVFILLPGPPSELMPMIDNFVLSKLKAAYPSLPRAEAHLHMIGLAESVVDHRIRSIIEAETGVQFTILAHLGLVDFDIFVTGASLKKARQRLARIVNKVRLKVGAAFYGRDDDYPLEKVVLKRFIAQRATLAVAESCTGGMLAERLTNIPGSSASFLGGVVSYSDAVKASLLGVPQEILHSHGAVSKQAAIAMAQNVRDKLGSAWGVGITGIAGPGGASAQKPVGLVFIALAGPQSIQAFTFHFTGSRDTIRQRSVLAALDALRVLPRL